VGERQRPHTVTFSPNLSDLLRVQQVPARELRVMKDSSSSAGQNTENTDLFF